MSEMTMRLPPSLWKGRGPPWLALPSAWAQAQLSTDPLGSSVQERPGKITVERKLGTALLSPQPTAPSSLEISEDARRRPTSLPCSFPCPSISNKKKKKDFAEKKTRFKLSARTLDIWSVSVASSKGLLGPQEGADGSVRA